MIKRNPITVLLARFEDIVERGLASMIDEDCNLVLVGRRVAHECLAERFATLHPDVAIVNFGSLTSGTEIRALSQQFPDTRLVMLASRPSASECRQMLAFGATACLAKNTEARDVLHAIYLASRGMTVLPRVADTDTAPIGPDVLTRREAEVLDLLQAGSSNAEIARKLSVGLETVRTHARHIYRKLGVNTRRELRVQA